MYSNFSRTFPELHTAYHRAGHIVQLARNFAPFFILQAQELESTPNRGVALSPSWSAAHALKSDPIRGKKGGKTKLSWALE
jgi:hypothetical protein